MAGARVTGLDCSEVAIDAARGFAEHLDIDATFVAGRVQDAPDLLPDAPYDIVYTGRGALCWLPDLDEWAAVCARLLDVGGILYLEETHPSADRMDAHATPDGRRLRPHYDPFSGAPVYSMTAAHMPIAMLTRASPPATVGITVWARSSLPSPVRASASSSCASARKRSSSRGPGCSRHGVHATGASPKDRSRSRCRSPCELTACPEIRTSRRSGGPASARTCARPRASGRNVRLGPDTPVIRVVQGRSKCSAVRRS